MACRDIETIGVCYLDPLTSTYRSLLQHVVYDTETGDRGVAFTEMDGVTDVAAVDTTAVTVGACPMISPDVEWQERCDVQADGSVVPFACQVITSFEQDGTPIVPPVVNNYELDKVTPYVPTGTVDRCPVCEPLAATGVQDSFAAIFA